MVILPWGGARAAGAVLELRLGPPSSYGAPHDPRHYPALPAFPDPRDLRTVSNGTSWDALGADDHSRPASSPPTEEGQGHQRRRSWLPLFGRTARSHRSDIGGPREAADQTALDSAGVLRALSNGGASRAALGCSRDRRPPCQRGGALGGSAVCRRRQSASRRWALLDGGSPRHCRSPSRRGSHHSKCRFLGDY